MYFDILPDLLPGIYSDILSGSILHLFRHSCWHSFSHLSWHPFWHSILHYSGIWHSLWRLAEVRQCPLSSGARSWGHNCRRRRKEEAEATLIKSRDPHKAGGEKHTHLMDCWPCLNMGKFWSWHMCQKIQPFSGARTWMIKRENIREVN